MLVNETQSQFEGLSDNYENKKKHDDLKTLGIYGN